LTKRKSFIWTWFRFWAYIHCTITLVGFVVYSPSTWWPVTKTDEYYLLTFGGALICYVVHRALKAWQKKSLEPDFTFEEFSK
jgi:hypothetical protein